MKNNIKKHIRDSVLVSVVLLSLLCVLIIQFVDLPYVPTWEELFGRESAFDTESDSVTFLNVGEGDSALIRSNGRFALIDTGDGKSTDIIRSLKKQGITGLDALILTHWHSDHTGAAEEIMEEFEVLNLVVPKLPKSTDELYESAISISNCADENLVDFNLAVQGLAVTVGDFRLSVVYCNPDNSEENNRSAVIMARCRDVKFLFMADAEKSLENEIIDYGINLDCDIIKIGHHGSKNSTGSNMLAVASPDYAVISVGADNSYGHPSSAVLDLLYYSDVKVIRTDRSGDIKFFVDEDGVELIDNS